MHNNATLQYIQPYTDLKKLYTQAGMLPPKEGSLDQVRDRLWLKNSAPRTEKTYAKILARGK